MEGEKNMKTYLITGGAGFIGSHLSEVLLKKGDRVICIDNFNNFYSPKIKEYNIAKFINNPLFVLYRIDITDEIAMNKVFTENHVDTVINLAAMAGVRPSIENPILYQSVNCMGFQILLDCMSKHNIKKLVAASSSSVYGNNTKVPFVETDVVDYAISPYAATKKANEVMGHVFYKLYDIDMIFLRFFTVYGPGQRPDLAIHKFTRMIDQGEMIPFFGDGNTSRDYTYIMDILDGVMKSIAYVESNHVYDIFNLGESTPITLNKMLDTIERHLGKKAIVKHLPMQPGDVNTTYADITKAKSLLNYQPTTKFDDGIEAFVCWYNKVKELGIYE